MCLGVWGLILWFVDVGDIPDSFGSVELLKLRSFGGGGSRSPEL